MKCYILVLFAFMVSFAVAPSALPQDRVKPPVAASLSVRTQKTHYYLLEPVVLRITGPWQTDCPPIDDLLTVIVISSEGRKVYHGLQSSIGTCCGEILPKGLHFDAVLGNPPLGSRGSAKNRAKAVPKYYEEFTYIDRMQEFFPKAGRYDIQFSLNGVTSNVTQLTLTEPKGGKDLEAFRFLSRFDDALTFHWIWSEKDGMQLLEYFVDKFGDSPYGDLATNSLGSVYYARGEYDKARIQFTKVKRSKNKALADDAVKSLENIPQNHQPQN